MKKTKKLKTWVGIFKNMGGNIPGGNFLGGNFPGGNSLGGCLIGGNFPGGSFPDTIFNKHALLKRVFPTSTKWSLL